MPMTLRKKPEPLEDNPPIEVPTGAPATAPISFFFTITLDVTYKTF
jgi:hypothetical protein